MLTLAQRNGIQLYSSLEEAQAARGGYTCLQVSPAGLRCAGRGRLLAGERWDAACVAHLSAQQGSLQSSNNPQPINQACVPKPGTCLHQSSGRGLFFSAGLSGRVLCRHLCAADRG